MTTTEDMYFDGIITTSRELRRKLLLEGYDSLRQEVKNNPSGYLRNKIGPLKGLSGLSEAQVFVLVEFAIQHDMEDECFEEWLTGMPDQSPCTKYFK
jgi:hypothetical protein